MKSKHTKGEWKLKTTSETEHQTIFIYSENFGAICQIPRRFKALEEQEANARLMKEAPKMLEELKFALIHLRRYSELVPDSKKWDNKTQSLHNHILRVREIIKKATS